MKYLPRFFSDHYNILFVLKNPRKHGSYFISTCITEYTLRITNLYVFFQFSNDFSFFDVLYDFKHFMEKAG